MKAPRQFFHVVIFIMLYKVVLTSESVDEIPGCEYLDQGYWAFTSILYHLLRCTKWFHLKMEAECL